MSKSILITGCSTGIGYCAAHELKKRGYRVFATARKEADVKKLQAEGFESFLLDVTNPASIKETVQEITQRTNGTLDALFNNAGFLVAGAIEDLSSAYEQAQFATNVFGPMELVRQILPIMRQQGHGRIIQNSSILGVITLPYYGAYNASKFALEGFSLTLQQELRGTNIYVSIINPGPIKSALRGTAYQQYKNATVQYEKSLHKSAYQQIEESYFNTSKQEQYLMLNPEIVVKKLLHALESNHPKTHYYVGIPAKMLAIAKRILPDSLLAWLLSKISYRNA